jgi:hypothetical protein
MVSGFSLAALTSRPVDLALFSRVSRAQWWELTTTLAPFMAIRCVASGGIWSMTGLQGPELTSTNLPDSPEPMVAVFIVEGGLIYLDKPMNGGFAAYEDGFTLLDLTRKYYRETGLDVRQLDSLVR